MSKGASISTAQLVMVVDDDEDLRETVCELLTGAEYRAVGAAEGASALELLRSGRPKPDLILLDLMMPGMSGWQFREEQLRDSALASIPVAVMTASSDLHGIQSDEIVRKPVARDVLLDVVRRLSSGEARAGPKTTSGSNAREQPSALSASEPNFRLIVSQMQAGFTQTDFEGRFIFSNARFREIVGRSEAELSQVRMQDIMHPDDVQLTLDEHERLVAEGTPFQVEHRCVKPDGSIIWMQTNVSRVDDDSGRAQSIASVTLEITKRKQAEAALRESEQRFRNMADHAPVMVWVIDAADACTFLSQSWYDFTGQTPDTALGFGWIDAIHPDDRDAVTRTFMAAKSRGEPFRLDYRLRRKDGVYRWAIDSASPRTGPSGEHLGYIGSVMDITERKASELALQRSEERIRELLEKEEGARKEAQALHSVAESLIEAKLDLEALVQRLTDRATELVGAHFGAFFYNVVSESGEAYRLYTLSGAPREAFDRFGLPRNTPLFGYTFSGRGVVRLDDVKADPRYGRMPPYYGMPEGHLPVTSYLAVPVVSRTGEVLGALFFGHPEAARFTEQHERMVVAIGANAAVAIDNAHLYRSVRSNEARFRTIFEASDVSIWEEDFSELRPLVEQLAREHGCGLRAFLSANPDVVQGALARVRILDFNPATLQLFEASEKAELLASLDNVCLPESYPVFVEQLMAIAEGKRTLSTEMPLRTLRGRRIDVLLTLSIPAADSRLERVLVTLIDISARKATESAREARLEEAERALTFSDTFIGILGHDLRNPLSAILTASDLLLQGETSERLARPIERIHHSAERMGRMIEQILDLTRARIGGGIPISPAPMDLEPLARHLVDELESSRGDIILQSVGSTEGEWDRDRLAQVISNLLGNAVEHGDTAQPIRLSLNGSAQGTLEITIWNGGAIPEKLLPSLFDPFQSATTGREPAQRAKGLGLGLYIVQQIVQAHLGSIEVRSTPSTGTTFAISLPRKAPSRR